jgi:hypothetical protein
MAMKSAVLFLIILPLSLALLAGCAPGANSDKGVADERNAVAGFWLGIWQGFIAPVVFVISLFRSSLNIYEIHNNGIWYNLGYLFGLACFFGGGGKGATSRKSRS